MMLRRAYLLEFSASDPLQSKHEHPLLAHICSPCDMTGDDKMIDAECNAPVDVLKIGGGFAAP